MRTVVPFTAICIVIVVAVGRGGDRGAATMVMYFEAKDGTLIYMGRDKFENEDLIKHGRETDLW